GPRRRGPAAAARGGYARSCRGPWTGSWASSDCKRPAMSKPTDNPLAATVPTPANSLLDEQNRCWLEGRPAGAEDYLERFPELRGDSEAVLDLIYNEVRLREDRGETPRPEDFYERFPEL